MSIRSVQTTFTASTASSWSHAHARPALANTVNIPRSSPHHPSNRQHQQHPPTPVQEKRLFSPPGLQGYHAGAPINSQTATPTPSAARPTHGRRRSGSFTYLPGNSYQSANFDLSSKRSSLTAAPTAAAKAAPSPVAPVSAQAANAAAAAANRPRPGLSRLPYAGGARSRMPYAYSAPQRRPTSTTAPDHQVVRIESLPIGDFEGKSLLPSKKDGSEKKVSLTAPVSRSPSPPAERTAPAVTPAQPAQKQQQQSNPMMSLNKDACARLVAGILLNRVHAVGKPMRRRLAQQQSCSLKGYSKSGLSNVVTVEV